MYNDPMFKIEKQKFGGGKWETVKTSPLENKGDAKLLAAKMAIEGDRKGQYCDYRISEA